MPLDFSALAAAYQTKIVQLASELVRIPSYSLQEKALAERIETEMAALGYDEIVRDAYGNVFGILRGTGGGASVTLNCHMDTVHEGDVSPWPYPPFGGVVGPLSSTSHCFICFRVSGGIATPRESLFSIVNPSISRSSISPFAISF